MTAVTPDTFDDQPFKLSMLLNDARYRSYTIQIIVMLLVMLGVAWIVNNTIQNLEALGKPLTFNFLWQPASYDIDQRLIEYDSRSPHWKAAIVGILNTLLVALLGCITATFLGVAAGVARLSNNWLVARLMTVYVEAFRNVPLLIWILIAIAIFEETFPVPRQAATFLGEAVAVTNRGIYIPSVTLGAGWTLVVGALILSIAAAWFFQYHSGRNRRDSLRR